MKPVLIISLIVLSCLGIGFYQHSRLAGLKAETMTLQQSSAKSSGRAQAHSRSSIAAATRTENIQPAKSLAEIEAMMTHSFELIAKSRTGERLDPAEQAEAMEAGKLLFSTFASLDHQTVTDLIEKLKTRANLPPELRENIAAACLEMLMQANPKEAIGLLQTSGDSPDRENQINQVFNQWANATPGEALRWFDEESKKGNPVADTAGIRKSAMLAQARVDPTRALSHEQLEKLFANPEESANLGASIAASLDDLRENSAFLAALRHEQEKFPASVSLAKIREEYIGELSGRIEKWAFEEASNLIDSEFSMDEKLAAVKRISHRADLADPTLWADWFSKIEVPKGTRHPLTQFVQGWMHAGDLQTAGKWLEHAPAGELKDGLIFEYAFVLADSDPAAAMPWLLKLPEGKLRIRGFREISKKWKAKDPSAAAAFAKEHDLPQ